MKKGNVCNKKNSKIANKKKTKNKAKKNKATESVPTLKTLSISTDIGQQNVNLERI